MPASNRVDALRRLASAALLCAALAAPAAAHGPDGDAEREARLGPLPAELAGVSVQLHRTAASQLVVANPTGRALEVLDERGAPFLRIGPDGVEGNLASPAWYRGFAPEGRVPRAVLERAQGAEPPPPRWVRAALEPSWGWFDARLEPGDGAGHGAPAAAHAAATRWEVPVRIDGQASALRGSFEVPAAPRGRLRARLDSPDELAPGLRVSLVPGRAASFLLESRSQQPATVLGSDGEPFLRFGPAGVEANLRSATFAAAARLRGGADLALAPRADGEPRWQLLSSVPRYAWVDPRTWADAGAAERVAASAEPVELLRWSVPVRVGAGEDAALVHIRGTTSWEPFAPGDGRQSRSAAPSAPHMGERG